MELTKQDNQMAKGVAILGMVMLHLFCRIENLPYTPLIWIGNTPLIYYLGLFGDLCVPIYCFCSGYAQIILFENDSAHYRKDSLLRLLKFLVNYWVVLMIFTFIGVCFDSTGTIPGSLWKFIGNLLLFNISYNGAWWFVFTYVILIALSPFIIKLVKKIPSWIVFIGSGIIYFVSYIFRFVMIMDSKIIS